MADFSLTKAKLIWQLKFEGAWPTSVAFLGPNRLAAGNREGQLFVWDLTGQPDEPAEKGKEEEAAPNLPPVHRLDGHTNGITHLLSTRDGRWLISSSIDHTVRLWQSDASPTGDGEAILDRESRERQAQRLPSDKRQAFLEAPGVPVKTCTAATLLEGHRDWVTALGISQDETRLISGDATCQAIVWDLAAGKEVSRFRGHPWNGVAAAALSPDGQTALLSEYTYKRDDFDIPAAALRLWNVADGSVKLDLLKLQFPKLDTDNYSYGSAQVWRKFVAGGLIAADFSPDGKLLAIGQGGETDTGKVHLFEVATGKLLRTVGGHQYGVTDVQFSPDGKYILSTGRDTSVLVSNVSDGKEAARLGKPRGGQFKDWLYALALSPDHQQIAAADIASLLHVWQL